MKINKKIVIIILSIIVIMAVISGVIYFVNQSNNNKDNVTSQNNNSEYSVEKGLENLAIIAKPAVENYLAQDITESSTSRNSRLGAYFATNSPVYSRDIEIKSTNSTTKTTAKVMSIESSDVAGEDLQLIAKTEITYYSNNSSRQAIQTYWISLIQNSSGVYIPYEIGLWNEQL
jgi:hypothetical protein